MGYWAGHENQRYYVEGNCVYLKPGGEQVQVDAITFAPLSVMPMKEAVSEETSSIGAATVLSDFTDEAKIEDFAKAAKVTKPIVHAKDCRSGGRGGRYTDGCPKCDFLKKGK